MWAPFGRPGTTALPVCERCCPLLTHACMPGWIAIHKVQSRLRRTRRSAPRPARRTGRCGWCPPPPRRSPRGTPTAPAAQTSGWGPRPPRPWAGRQTWPPCPSRSSTAASPLTGSAHGAPEQFRDIFALMTAHPRAPTKLCGVLNPVRVSKVIRARTAQAVRLQLPSRSGSRHNGRAAIGAASFGALSGQSQLWHWQCMVEGMPLNGQSRGGRGR